MPLYIRDLGTPPHSLQIPHTDARHPTQEWV